MIHAIKVASLNCLSKVVGLAGNVPTTRINTTKIFSAQTSGHSTKPPYDLNVAAGNYWNASIAGQYVHLMVYLGITCCGKSGRSGCEHCRQACVGMSNWCCEDHGRSHILHKADTVTIRRGWSRLYPSGKKDINQSSAALFWIRQSLPTTRCRCRCRYRYFD